MVKQLEDEKARVAQMRRDLESVKKGKKTEQEKASKLVSLMILN